MTIAVAVKVPGGLVLASGSAEPMPGRDATPPIVSLPGGCPVALLAWGSPGIGPPPATLAEGFGGRHAPGAGEEYSLHGVAVHVMQSIAAEQETPADPDSPPHGILIAGYGADALHPEVWQIDLRDGGCDGPRCVAAGEGSAIHWAGEAGALARLCRGAGAGLARMMAAAEIPTEECEEIIRPFHEHLSPPRPIPPLALGDVISMAISLADLIGEAARYLPGVVPPVGSIEIASITREDGFVRIEREVDAGRESGP